MNGAVEAEAGEPLGLPWTGAESGAPQEAARLLGAEASAMAWQGHSPLHRHPAARLAGIRQGPDLRTNDMERVWDYPRPPALVPCERRVRMRLGGVEIADSTRALRVLETSHHARRKGAVEGAVRRPHGHLPSPTHGNLPRARSMDAERRIADRWARFRSPHPEKRPATPGTPRYPAGVDARGPGR